jgi:hypothetical protein
MTTRPLPATARAAVRRWMPARTLRYSGAPICAARGRPRLRGRRKPMALRPCNPNRPTHGLSLRNPNRPTHGLSLRNPNRPTRGLSLRNPNRPTRGLSLRNPNRPTRGLSTRLPKDICAAIRRPLRA